MINTEKFRIQQSQTVYDCCIVKTCIVNSWAFRIQLS